MKTQKEENKLIRNILHYSSSSLICANKESFKVLKITDILIQALSYSVCEYFKTTFTRVCFSVVHNTVTILKELKFLNFQQ